MKPDLVTLWLFLNKSFA